MVFLFRSGTYVSSLSTPVAASYADIYHTRLREKFRLILKATRQHARNLAVYAAIYKSTMLFLRLTSPDGKEAAAHTFLAGLVGGYIVFGRGIQSSVNQQIVIYVFARAMLALAKLTVQREGGMSRIMRKKVTMNAWPVFASLSWGIIMWTYRWHPETIQPSLKSSMEYMYVYSSNRPKYSEMIRRACQDSDGTELTWPFFRRYVDSDHWDSVRNLFLYNK